MRNVTKHKNRYFCDFVKARRLKPIVMRIYMSKHSMEYAQVLEAFLNARSAMTLMEHLGDTRTPDAIRKIKALVDILKRLDDPGRHRLMDDQREALRDMHNALRKTSIVDLRNAAGTLSQLFGLRRGIPLGITPLLAAFLKGITYFGTDAGFPIYHRMFSCGPYEHHAAYRDAHTDCAKATRVDEKQRRGRIAETCYIERSVYNLLYEHEVLHIPATSNDIDHAQQDRGHQQALDDAEKDFHKCFPGTRLSCRLVYEGRVPTQLIIDRQRGRSKTVETYVHNGNLRVDAMGTVWKYDDIVVCTKQTDERRHIKVQTSLSASKWALFRGTSNSVPGPVTEMADNLRATA